MLDADFVCNLAPTFSYCDIMAANISNNDVNIAELALTFVLRREKGAMGLMVIDEAEAIVQVKLSAFVHETINSQGQSTYRSCHCYVLTLYFFFSLRGWGGTNLEIYGIVYNLMG